MRPGRYLVFDLDFDVLEPFRDRQNAIRFAQWLARGRADQPGVFVSDEHASGKIVWPASRWLELGRIAC